MHAKSFFKHLLLVVLMAPALLLSLSVPAHAKEVKPAVFASAWYWQHSQSQDAEAPAVGTVTVDTNNEFCPQVPGGGLGNVSEETCAEARLPIRIVNGDYEKPDQLSAVMFDTITTIPIGSKVHEFTATFLEAKSGCREKETAQTGQQCEATQPVNADGHELQACLATQFFGEGFARPYKEVPDHECTNSDPTAERKKVTVDGEEAFEYTFDLTEFAQPWADGKPAGIVLTGAEPKEPPAQDTWRVVLVGPVDKGIEVNATITEPPPLVIDPLDPLDPTGPTTTVIPGDPGTSGTPGSPGTEGTPPTETTTGDDETTAGAPEPGDAQAPPVDVAEETATKPIAANTGPPGGGLPGYAWLGLIAGLAGFSLVRSAVLEGAAGIRPDGVLAHIQKLNAERRGGAGSVGLPQSPLFAALGATAGVLAGATKSFGSKLSSLATKAKGMAKR